MANQLASDTTRFKFSIGQEVWLIWGHRAAKATVHRQTLERHRARRGPDNVSVVQTESYEVEMANHTGQPIVRDAETLFASKQALLDHVADEGG